MLPSPAPSLAAGHAGGVTDDLQVTPAVRIPAEELGWRFSRSSGPGGQGVNTTDSRVELWWNLAASAALTDAARERAVERLGRRLVDGVLTVTASEHRSQLRNREAALARLAAAVREAIAPPAPVRRPTRPSRAARRRRMDDKRRRGDIKRLRRPDGD
jgi:ribosome-associated protein